MTMPRVIGHLIFWLIALVALAVIVLFLGFYLYAQVQPLRDEPLVAITLKDLGHLVFFVAVAVGGPGDVLQGLWPDDRDRP